MSTPCEDALAALVAELDSISTKVQTNQSAWYRRQALALGVSFLRTMVAQGKHNDPVYVATFRASLRKDIIAPVEVPQ